MASTDELPWNTTRCNRLLRPLSSKLAKLRKELEQPQNSNSDRRSSANVFSLKASPRKAALFSKSAAPKPARLEKRNDPDWMPTSGPAGAGRKTYGGRGAKKATAAQRVGTVGGSTRPGEIAFTPLIARTGHFQESPQFSASPIRKYSNRGPLIARAEQIQELRKTMPANIGNLVKGLSEAYANLLKATTASGEKQWKGTRSLFSACLRKMPDYIELEEYFAKLDQEEDEEDLDMSQDIYNHLEAQFESHAGQGWRAFKQIVRAHGTSLLCDAFADQILSLETLRLLVSHCSHSDAWDEAEKLLWAYLPNLKPLSMPNTLEANLFSEQRSLYMWMAKDFVIRTGRHRFLYDLLEYMVSQELLPLEWLATECMRPVWDRLVRTIADGDYRSLDNAFHFLETTMFAGIGLPDESLFEEGEIDTVARHLKPSSRDEFRQALDTTFSSLFKVFSSIALVNRNREEASGDQIVQRVTWTLDSIVVGLLKREDIKDDLDLLGPLADNMQTFAERAVSIVFSSFLVHLEGCRLDATKVLLDVPTTIGAISWIASQYSSKHVDMSTALATLPEFASSAARGTGRIWKDDGYDQIQRLVHGMLSLSGVRLPHKLWTLKRLALESVMEFAYSTGEVQHMSYARKIEKTMRTNGHIVISHSPQKDASPSTSGGFRWEEGIGEWVACTPFAKQGAKNLPRRPMRPLELLPTPELSDDNTSDTEELLQETADDVSGMAIPDNNDDYAFPQSSPVKKGRQFSTSSLGKRSRPSSPIVLIPSKRVMLSPPDSPSVFYPELPEVSFDDEVRRSRRTRKEMNASVSTLRSRRSRSSLDRGLRNQQRKMYEEPEDINVDLEENGEDESDHNTSFSSSSSSIDQQPRPIQARRGRPPKRNNSIATQSRPDSPISLQSDVDEKPHPRQLRRARSTRSSLGTKSRQQSTDLDEDRDELSKTPRVKRRQSGRKVQGLKEWWKVDGGAIDVEDESEDELSFN
ncbi:hypothetical protein P280DRAFT_474305 [Massarina eburnea CBS 473.64]|uniref:Uncharacterized protein n=1 Tax=Massarina eburnea CBS 473.64 TaxID=1395130 RepID=A0A6A6RK88_9PLEO|nr:hypothetical protein P280DRAFT_474305 [Massarina eburnea CBS 473.64]